MNHIAKALIYSVIICTCINQESYAEEYMVPYFTWVQVVRPKGIIQRYSNSRVEIEDGDSCAIYESSSVKALGSDNGYTLVEYDSEGMYTTGTGCPDGVKFLIPSEELSSWNAEYELNKAKRLEREELINRIPSKQTDEASK